MSEQPGFDCCPVNSFKHYISNLNKNCESFFQYPDRDKRKYGNRPIGKNTLGKMMKTISENTGLSKIYTSHYIHKTTATGMKRQGFDLEDIADVMKHKNLQSLEFYIGGPTHKEKENYSEALLTTCTMTVQAKRNSS